MKTPAVSEKDVVRSWYLVDADGAVLGRMAARIATVLTGKHKPAYTPNNDTGDFVIVTNAGKVKATGNKAADKLYHRYSGYPGGLKSTPFSEQIEKKPEEVIRLAVWGMMPKNKLSRRMMRKLKIYRDANHPHEAQRPEPLKI